MIKNAFIPITAIIFMICCCSTVSGQTAPETVSLDNVKSFIDSKGQLLDSLEFNPNYIYSPDRRYYLKYKPHQQGKLLAATLKNIYGKKIKKIRHISKEIRWMDDFLFLNLTERASSSKNKTYIKTIPYQKYLPNRSYRIQHALKNIGQSEGKTILRRHQYKDPMFPKRDYLLLSKMRLRKVNFRKDLFWKLEQYEAHYSWLMRDSMSLSEYMENRKSWFKDSLQISYFYGTRALSADTLRLTYTSAIEVDHYAIGAIFSDYQKKDKDFFILTGRNNEIIKLTDGQYTKVLDSYDLIKKVGQPFEQSLYALKLSAQEERLYRKQYENYYTRIQDFEIHGKYLLILVYRDHMMKEYSYSDLLIYDLEKSQNIPVPPGWQPFVQRLPVFKETAIF